MTKRKIKYSNTSNKKLKRKNNLEKEIKKILSAFPDNKSDYGNIITKNGMVYTKSEENIVEKKYNLNNDLDTFMNIINNFLKSK